MVFAVREIEKAINKKWNLALSRFHTLRCNYSVHHRGLSLSKTGNNISMINVI